LSAIFRWPRVHVRDVLLVLVAAHARADDVEQSKNASLRTVDDALLEVLEVLPARAACVDNCCDAGPEGEAVGGTLLSPA